MFGGLNIIVFITITLFHTGVAKLCNNLSLAISMIGTCEAMNLVSEILVYRCSSGLVCTAATHRCVKLMAQCFSTYYNW